MLRCTDCPKVRVGVPVRPFRDGALAATGGFQRHFKTLAKANLLGLFKR